MDCRIIKLVAALPDTVIGRAIKGQLVRAGTSVGANFRAACRARSRAEFISRLGVVEEEADESGYWIELRRCRIDEVPKVRTFVNRSKRTGSDYGVVKTVGCSQPAFGG